MKCPTCKQREINGDVINCWPCYFKRLVTEGKEVYDIVADGGKERFVALKSSYYTILHQTTTPKDVDEPWYETYDSGIQGALTEVFVRLKAFKHSIKEYRLWTEHEGSGASKSLGIVTLHFFDIPKVTLRGETMVKLRNNKSFPAKELMVCDVLEGGLKVIKVEKS